MARIRLLQKLHLDPKTYVMPGEDPQDFIKLANEFESSHKPMDVCERFLVEQLIIDTWRLRRYERILPQVQTVGTEKSVSRLTKIITDIQRCIRTNLADLRKMQAAGAKLQRKGAPKVPQLDDSLPPTYYIN
jgi:hypothetical protein